MNLGLGHFFGALLAQHAGVHLGGGDVLGGDVFLDLIGCVGLGALGLLLFAESLELQLFVLFRLGDGGFSGQTGLFPQLAGLGGLDLLGFIGFGFSNAGLGFHFGNLGAAQGDDVVVVVGDVVDGEGFQFQTDFTQGFAGNFGDAGAEFLAVVINFLHSHGGNDLAQLAFAQALHLFDDLVFGAVLIVAIKHLHGGENIGFIGFDLQDHIAVGVDGHAQGGFDVLDIHIQRQRLQRDHVHALQQGNQEHAAARDNLGLAQADNHCGVIIGDFFPGFQDHEDNHDQGDNENEKRFDNGAVQQFNHIVLLF